MCKGKRFFLNGGNKNIIYKLGVGCSASPHPLKANPLTGLAPLGLYKNIQITQKNYKK